MKSCRGVEKSPNLKSICHVEITYINYMPRVWRSAFSARKCGYDVKVIGFGKDEIYNGVEYRGIAPASGRLRRVLFTSKKMVDIAAKSDAHIVELHSPELLLYSRKLKRAGKRIVFNSHEFYALQILRREYLPQLLRGVISKVYRIWEKSICKKMDYIIYPCTVKGKNPFEDYACKSVKIENYSDEVDYVRGVKEQRTAIYAGSLTEDRGCTTMVELFNKINGKLYLAGSFSTEEYKDYVLNIINPDKVEYLGALSREELFKYYSKVSVGLSLLKKEGQYNEIDNLSTKMYEYMSCGIPVVATDMEYAKQVNEKYHFGILVNPDNADEIEAAIEKIFSDSNLATMLGENGMRAIKEEFNWKSEQKKLVSVYDKMME